MTSKGKALPPTSFTPGTLVSLGDLSAKVGYDVVHADPTDLARRLVDELTRRELTVAVAESLTGGLVAATIVDVPGASAVFRGGAVTYATDTKASVLGVSPERLAETGPVDDLVAIQMADGVARLFDSDVSLSTTGVAGPGPSDGHAAGTVWVGLSARSSRETDQAEGVSEVAADVNGVKSEEDVSATLSSPSLEESAVISKETVTNRSPSSFPVGESGNIDVSNGDGGSGKHSALSWRFEIPGERSLVRKLTVNVAILLLLLEISTIS